MVAVTAKLVDDPCEEQAVSPEPCRKRERLRPCMAISAEVGNLEVDGFGDDTGRGIQDFLITKESSTTHKYKKQKTA